MDLYLHIGTEKTGSSYLQSVAAMNRDVLMENRYFFPKGRLEEQMINGQISDGNAQNITDAIYENNFVKIEEIIGSYVSDNIQNDENLLLSNEILVLALSNGGKLRKFLEVLKNVGIRETKMLLVLRDPVDQALSLFKHRSKHGMKSQIEEWSKKKYHYGESLNDFIDSALYYDINLKCRKYSKNSGTLENLFFREWLGINDSLKLPENKVNPSLTLSELFIIDSFKKVDQVLAHEIYDRFLKLPNTNKADEPYLEKYYRQVLAEVISGYEETWKKCNLLLGPAEQLTIPQKRDEANHSEVISLKTEQIEIISGIVNDLKSVPFVMKLFLIKCKNRLRKFVLSIYSDK